MLWLARNETREGKKMEEPHVLAKSVCCYLEEWNKAHGNKQPKQKIKQKERWTPPEQD